MLLNCEIEGTAPATSYDRLGWIPELASSQERTGGPACPGQSIILSVTGYQVLGFSSPQMLKWTEHTSAQLQADSTSNQHGDRGENSPRSPHR